MHKSICLEDKKNILLWYTDLDGSLVIEGVIPKENKEEVERYLGSEI